MVYSIHTLVMFYSYLVFMPIRIDAYYNRFAIHALPYVNRYRYLSLPLSTKNHWPAQNLHIWTTVHYNIPPLFTFYTLSKVLVLILSVFLYMQYYYGACIVYFVHTFYSGLNMNWHIIKKALTLFLYLLYCTHKQS